MMTAKLWRALNNPPATHPFFQRTVVLPPSPRHYLSWAGILISLIIGLSQYSPILLMFLMPLLMMIVGLTYGLDCSLRIADAIAREHERNTFNLMALSPPGPFGASWTIGTSALYRNHDFHRLRTIVKTTIAIGVGLALMGSAFTLLVNSGMFSRFPQPPGRTLVGMVNALLLLLALYIEYIQSTVLGSLVGIIVPTYARSRIDANLFAFGAFLLLQVLAYALAALVDFTILPTFFEVLHWYGDMADVSLSLVRLAVFYALREGFITLGWRVLAQRLNVTRAELDFMSG